jgi:hypothetical protein
MHTIHMHINSYKQYIQSLVGIHKSINSLANPQVNSALRCSLCSRPLTMSEPAESSELPSPSPSSPSPPPASSIDTKESSHTTAAPLSLSTLSSAGAVILSDRVGYHRGCYARATQLRDKVRQPTTTTTTSAAQPISNSSDTTSSKK